jgi:hypothetical protein
MRRSIAHHLLAATTCAACLVLLFFPGAVVKVLKLLPAEAMRFQLPRTLQKVANLLKHRMQSSRCSGWTVWAWAACRA